MQSELIKPVFEYLGKQPFTNVLILALLGAIIWARLENTAQLNRMQDGFIAALNENERRQREDKRVLFWALLKKNFEEAQAEAKKAGALE